jgi:hypothetical protein
MLLKSAVAVACSSFLCFSTAAHGQTMPPAVQAPASAPEHQTTFAQAGIRLSLHTALVGQNQSSATLTIENGRAAPVHFAALTGRKASGSQAVLSDGTGSACIAEFHPVGIAQIQHLSQAPRPALASMTTIPPRSRMNAVFRFSGCRLSSGPLSFAGEFALSTNGQDVELVTVPFWGITPKSAGQ